MQLLDIALITLHPGTVELGGGETDPHLKIQTTE